ncbi:hypothetical protein AVEN_241902-1 [Araneus ventricosus]|uniref:Uncharacterized protein n=1 Tax=Araneus ventricosus TaxID=182803 RepID=A0A4Y2R9G0_ARAVE|nr:hypothetical protein AVEN_154485-1 [Araneus ventricosus]GBN72676.1 hypothetical protein AVEN_241902-1 [Araneus ventricosus]
MVMSIQVQCGVIHFLCKESVTTSEIFRRMQVMYGELEPLENCASNEELGSSGRLSFGVIDKARCISFDLDSSPQSIAKQFLVFPLGNIGSPALQSGFITLRYPCT